MKAIRLFFIAVLALAGHVPHALAEPVTLSFSHSAPATHPMHVAALQFAKRVEERTNGQVKVEVFPDGQLGGQNEMMQKVRLGVIDMGSSTSNYFIKYEKAFAATVMPYVFDNYEHAHRVLDGPAMAWLAPLAEKQGYVILSNWEWGFRSLSNNRRAVDKPGDVQGLKIRVPPGVELEAVMAALGAEVSKISLKELRPALSQGAIDGQENPVNVLYYNKLYEVQKHLALTRHVYNSTLHFISAKSWARLTPAQQKIVREESRVAAAFTRKTMIGEEEELIAKMAAAGVKVTRPDLKPFRAMMEPAYQQARLAAGDENVRTFLQMVDAGRKR